MYNHKHHKRWAVEMVHKVCVNNKSSDQRHKYVLILLGIFVIMQIILFALERWMMLFKFIISISEISIFNEIP